MKKGINIVVLGVLTVISIILALPFKPLRNSFDGLSTKAADKAINRLDVDFTGKINNARKIAASHEYEMTYLDLASSQQKAGSRSVPMDYSAVKQIQDMGGYYMVAARAGQTANSMPGDLSFVSAARNQSPANTKSIGGYVAINSKLNTSTSSSNSTTQTGTTTRQSGNVDNNGSGGGTHPGVDPTPPPSLALGNGLILFLFAFGYVILKKWD